MINHVFLYEFKINIDGEAGKPTPLNRPRFKRIGKKVMTYSTQDKEKTAFKNAVANKLNDLTKEVIENAKLKDFNVEIDMDFYVEIQKTGSQKTKAKKENKEILPTLRPDLDNYIKFVMDSLHDVIYEDDKVVTGINAHKYYSSNPRTELTIRISYQDSRVNNSL